MHTQRIPAGTCIGERMTHLCRDLYETGHARNCHWDSARDVGVRVGRKAVFTVEPAILLELPFNHVTALIFILMFLIVGKQY